MNMTDNSLFLMKIEHHYSLQTKLSVTVLFLSCKNVV